MHARHSTHATNKQMQQKRAAKFPRKVKNAEKPLNIERFPPTKLAAIFVGWANKPLKNVHYPTCYLILDYSTFKFTTLPEIEKPQLFRP